MYHVFVMLYLSAVAVHGVLIRAVAWPRPPFSVATSESRTLNLTLQAPPSSASSSTLTAFRIDVDEVSPSARRQKIEGFGAAWTDAAVTCLDALDPAVAAHVLSALFGAQSMARLQLMRHTIGQSDLTPASEGEWSYDTNGNVPDPALVNFTLTAPGARLAEYVRRMRELDPTVVLFGSPWSPPQWMKRADNSVDVQKYGDVWAAFMRAYLRAFAAANATVDALTPQNEPLHSADAAWTTLMSADDQIALVTALGGLLAADNDARIRRTRIWTYDHNTDRPDYPASVLRSTAARPYVSAVAWHCYAGGSDQWSALSDFHATFPGVAQYMTECWLHVQDESFFELSDFVLGPMRNWASGALAWTLVGSTRFDVSYPGGCAQCSGLVQVDREARTFELQQDFYSLAQFSAFVDRGSVAVDTVYAAGAGVQAQAFVRPDGARVVVMQNKLTQASDVEIALRSGAVWRGTLEARSVTTWVLP